MPACRRNHLACPEIRCECPPSMCAVTRRRFSRSYGATGAVPLRFRLPNMNLTETGMSTSALAPAAQDEIATLSVGFELSKATWLIGLYSPQLGKTISRYKVDGGDADAALERITVARLRLEKLGKPVRVVSIYEAGYDGFWLHRRLTAAGIENRVVDAASIPVERRSRRRKTDRIDLELLISHAAGVGA